MGGIDSSIHSKLLKNRQKEYDLSKPTGYKEYVNRSKGGFSRGTLFIDEGQDCHPLERDIFLELHQRHDIIVATGGKEQLIRHQQECPWHIDNNGKKLQFFELKKGEKSLRMKEEIINLCNFIADRFNIKIKLEPHHHNDKGNIIIDINRLNNYSIIKIFSKLRNNELKFGLSKYENIMFLLEAENQTLFNNKSIEKQITITSDDNIHESNKEYKECILDRLLAEAGELDKDNFFMHNMMSSLQQKERDNISQEELLNDDNYETEEDNYPSQDKYRILFYESCRGLEAWSVVCFGIDAFFQRKKEEDIAAEFLSDDIFLTEEERRTKYAATWVLMALTRAMDTLYLQIENPDSEFGKIMQEYVAFCEH